MAELKTRKNAASISAFLKKADPKKRDACEVILDIMGDATGEEPVMWGSTIIGFGSYHFKYATGKEGDWALIGVSPRKQNISVYIMDGFSRYEKLLSKLGKHKIGKSCLYINKLSDIDMKVFARLVQSSVRNMKKMYPPLNSTAG
jgi:hypothetical protein